MVEVRSAGRRELFNSVFVVMLFCIVGQREGLWEEEHCHAICIIIFIICVPLEALPCQWYRNGTRSGAEAPSPPHGNVILFNSELRTASHPRPVSQTLWKWLFRTSFMTTEVFQITSPEAVVSFNFHSRSLLHEGAMGCAQH